MREKNKADKVSRLAFMAWFILLMLLFLAMLAQTTPAQAQETATPMPTADTNYIIELSTGSEVEIERSIDYGQMAIVTALGIVALLLFMIGLFNLVTHYIH